MTLTKEDYDRLVLAKIEDKDQRERAEKVFDNYGSNLAFDVFNIMLHAIGLEKIPEVLVILEQHYREHLSFQHPEIRGTVEGMSGNATKATFVGICRDTLKLAMNTQEAS